MGGSSNNGNSNSGTSVLQARPGPKYGRIG